MNLRFLEELKNILKTDSVLLDEVLKRHTTFRIGGPAEYFVELKTIETLVLTISLCNEHQIRYKVIGNGSNLLFSDKGFQGLIIKNGMNPNPVFKPYAFDESQVMVTVGSGMLLSNFVRRLSDHCLTGYEFAYGIPGTIGGAVVMNAGAYGGQIGDSICEVQVLDESGKIHLLAKEELAFSYRSSVIRQKGYIVLTVSFLLKKGNKEEILRKMDQHTIERKQKQPLEYPSAGSAFKRPEGNYAGKLIMEAGLSGLQIGGAKVSEKHCGFIINAENATAEDVKNLLLTVKKKVKEHSGYELETEIEIIN